MNNCKRNKLNAARGIGLDIPVNVPNVNRKAIEGMTFNELRAAASAAGRFRVGMKRADLVEVLSSGS